MRLSAARHHGQSVEHHALSGTDWRRQSAVGVWRRRCVLQDDDGRMAARHAVRNEQHAGALLCRIDPRLDDQLQAHGDRRADGFLARRRDCAVAGRCHRDGRRTAAVGNISRWLLAGRWHLRVVDAEQSRIRADRHKADVLQRRAVRDHEGQRRAFDADRAQLYRSAVELRHSRDVDGLEDKHGRISGRRASDGAQYRLRRTDGSQSGQHV